RPSGALLPYTTLFRSTWLTTNFFLGSTGAEVEVSIDGGSAEAAERTQQMQGEAQNVGAEYSDPYAVSQQLVHGGSLADRTMHLRSEEHTSELQSRFDL